MDRGAWEATAHGFTQELDTTQELNNSSLQFSSVTHLCLTLCDPMNQSMLGLPVYHQLPESTQTHVH